MLKYPEIIAKLNLRQKLALLTDIKSLSDAEIDRAGVPAVVLASLEELNGEGSPYPSFFELARSWDPALFGEVAGAVSSAASGRGVNLVLSPDLKSGITPYALRLSEDPFVSGALGKACLEGIRSAGVGSCLARRSVSGEDAEYLDVKESAAVIRKFYESPFAAAAEGEGPDAYLCSLARLAGDYSDVNRRTVRNAMKEDGFLLCEDVPHDMDMGSLLKGNVCLGGAVLPLDTAVGRYHRLVRLIEEGGATQEELDAAVKRGTALPEEAIDEGVDRVIDFAYRIAAKKAAARELSEETVRRAAEESTVLMKNDGVLPIAQNTRVAVIGALAAEGEDSFAVRFSRIARLDYDLGYAGQADGYDLSREQSEELIPEAVRIAEDADVILLFLGQGADRERGIPALKSVALPASQIALIDALRRTGKKIVAVLSGDYPVEMDFDKEVNAVLLVPAGGTPAHDVLIKILTGKRNPSGKLTRSYYDNTDALFLALKNYKDAGRNKVGEFVGYRRYDTAGNPPRYPFGHGLSYTAFSYSALEVNEVGVRFTLTNCGAYAGTETVQVYAGKSGVRPKKELIAFERVTLGPDESRVIEIALPETLFSYYNEETQTSQTEGGLFTVYIGSSVSDVRLKGLFSVNGEERPQTQEQLSDYLQSESNLMYRGYTLKEARARALRNRKEHRAVRLGGWILLAVAILADVLLIAAHVAVPDLAGYGGGMFAVNLFLVLAVIALIGERATRSKGAVESLPAASEKFRGADTAGNDALESYFLKELEEKEEEEVHAAIGEEEDYFDESFTFERACEEFSAYTEDCGLALSKDSVRALMAAIASTRCIVLRGRVKQLLSLAGMLCEYFGTAFQTDAAEGYRETEDLFYKEGKHGVREKSNFYRALLSANEMRPYLHFAVLSHVDLSALGGYFSPVVQQLKDPRTGRFDPEGYGRGKVAIPPNLRFVLILAEGQDASSLPGDIADVSSFLIPELKVVAPHEEKRLPSPFGYHQFTELNRRAKLTCEIEEPLWKKVDRLESAVDAGTPYRIGNRVWLAIENYTAVYLSCGGIPADALDSAVAAKLLVRINGLWQSGKDEKLPSVMEKIFGEGNVPRCERMLRLIKREGEEEV